MKQLDKSRNSLGTQMAYLDRMLIHSLDSDHKEIWQKIRRDSKLVAADAQAAADEDTYTRVAHHRHYVTFCFSLGHEPSFSLM